jgi:hypothetical protein
MKSHLLNKLPKGARDLWQDTYLRTKEEYGVERASQLAMEMVKKHYNGEGEEMILRTADSVEFKSEQPYLRSVLGADMTKEYFVEGIVATTEPQRDGVQLTRGFLEHIIDNQFRREDRALLKGDIEHAADYKERGGRVGKEVETDEDVLRLDDYKIIDEYGVSKLWCKFQVDRTADNFDKLLYKLKNKFYDSFSASFSIDKGASKLVRDNDGDYITQAFKGSLKRATLTGTPMDKLSVLTSFYQE